MPFQGSAPAINALVGGHIGYTMDVVTEALAQYRAGKVRVITVAGAQRAPQLPNVPTLRAQGVAMHANAWLAMDGNAGMRSAQAERLSLVVGAGRAEGAGPCTAFDSAGVGADWVDT